MFNLFKKKKDYFIVGKKYKMKMQLVDREFFESNSITLEGIFELLSDDKDFVMLSDDYHKTKTIINKKNIIYFHLTEV